GARALRRLAPGAAAPLADVRVPDIYRRLDDLDAHTFLDRIRFPDTARHLAFDVFSRSFFARPEALSAAELAVMFHLYFLGSAEGLLFDVPERPFDRLWDPLVGRLDRHGATVHTGTPVHAVTPPETPGAPFRLATAGRTVPADAVVLALDV
ncbi:FAD-dependent oxidoreductase, partial [Saccharomonospora iraqiensis]|uniref:FAD-dependent oxidoreductase n=1 Tax=Saccharomonospora iraqiensis TaxID=52698 RepID=UPI000593735F